jgi:hypothetical protein
MGPWSGAAVAWIAALALALLGGGAPRTQVVAVYPTGDHVPANLLKIYIEFSGPMREGDAAARARLVDERGHTVEGAFLRLDEELWDPSRRRLTLLLDPGRVKRGLKANVQSGAPLRAGQTITLEVDGAWLDAAGRPLVAGVRRQWRVDAADRVSPDPARWRIDAPEAGTRAALTVLFGEPLDRALLARFLRVEAADGRAAPGEATVGPHESSWRIVPAAPWSADTYHLAIDARLEDLAANRLSSLFDVDLTQRLRSTSQAGRDGFVRRAFQPRAALETAARRTRMRCVSATLARTVSEAPIVPIDTVSPSSNAAHSSVSTGCASCS